MTIPWLYLDKRMASVNALKDFPSMQRIIANYSDDIAESQAHLTSPRAAASSGAGAKDAPNPRASETIVASTLDLIDVVNERHKQALEYMAWFMPAWIALSETERHILSSFFLQENVSRSEVLEDLCNHYGFERTAIYSRKDKALGHLALLLYGK